MTNAYGPPHTDAFFIRSGAFRHDVSTYMHGRIVADRNARHEKRIRVGREYRLNGDGLHEGITLVKQQMNVKPMYMP